MAGAQQEEGDDYGLIVEVTANAIRQGGGAFFRRATLRLRQDSRERPWQVLAWESGAP